MGFTDEGRFSEGEAVLPPCAGRIRGLSCKPRHRKVPGFLFLDDRRPGRGVAIRDRCVGPGEFISAPGVWKSCGFRTLHEI